MPGSLILEISVETLETATAAERGGADRIELCANAHEGGTTPGSKLMHGARAKLKIPIFAIIRPRAGNFVYSDAELEEMRGQIEEAKNLGMDGFVLGVLREDGKVDAERTRDLVERARPLPVTYHRAFDECKDLRKALEDVIKTGAARLLTSGGKPKATEALAALTDLVRLAGTRMAVMPGSGLHAGNIAEAVRVTRAREYHAALSSVVARPAENLSAFEKAVSEMASALAACA